MNIQGKTVFVTGANRGIGADLVRALLKHGAGKVYAGARDLQTLPDFGDSRVAAVQLDVTRPEAVSAAALQVGELDILVNNAGVMNANSLLTATPADLAADMAVNYYGTVSVIQAFVPLLEKKGGGVIANVLSVLALAPMAQTAGYAASKAALHSVTQAARAELKPKNINVVSIFPGPIDTEMAAGLHTEKASPAAAAEEIVNGLAGEQEDIFPDPVSAQVAGFWGSNPKGLEHHFATL
ncbi:SDR family oxidoreductase [Enterobacter sp. Cy-643]|uniref:SDR family oxidoreductase n=1 Tax=Enterobacter sp. Cy-643 TaxID=2608346 RepID=UPI001423485A|nr:SDR family oxidoreductase [Enterobacter sp. Cy-643]NIF30750.1 SDR family oxidoreductase [Enterobacter sp. Cy-643]